MFSIDQAEKVAILRGMAATRFSPEKKTLEEWNQSNLTIAGKAHPSLAGVTVTAQTMLSSEDWHTLKHTEQGEWAAGTTTAEYLLDLKTAFLASPSLHVGKSSTRRRTSSRAAGHVDMQAAQSRLRKALVIPGHSLLALYDPVRRCAVSVYRMKSTAVTSTLQRWNPHRVF